MIDDKCYCSDYVWAEAETGIPVFDESLIVYQTFTKYIGSSLQAEDYRQHRKMKQDIVHYHIFNEFIPAMLRLKQ